MTAGTQQRLSWPLIGRDGELAFALSHLSEQPAGGVVISGEPGVGKTRLAHEIAAAVADAGREVRWVRATRSAASIPLGAFAPLLPPPEGAAGLADLLARARHALCSDGRPIVLCIDDAQLLDDASATLAHQLVAAGDAFVVATVRQGESAPDAVRALWKDELCAFVPLPALTRDTMALLLDKVLGGSLDGRSVELLWELTRGNALFLRELVHHGVEHGSLAPGGGIWRWRGEPALGMRLTELVETRLADLPPAALDVLELVAVGAPLEVGLLDDRETAALEVLELRGLVERVEDRRRRYVDVAHPVHGEVIRSRLARTRLERIQLRLADAVAAHGARRREDILRVAGWRLACGDADDCGVFMRAAEHALALVDWSLAERFATVAVQAGGGFRARLALARALAGTGRAVEAEGLLGALEREAHGDVERWGVAIARASNLFWGLDRTGDADAVLRAGERVIADAGLRDELVVLRAWLVCTLGDPAAALAAAEPLLRSDVAREQTRLRAALTVATALTMRGRGEDALAVVDAWLPAARDHRDELPLLEGMLLGTRPLALQAAGRLVEATDAAQRAYELNLAARSPEATAHAAFALASAWLARGRARTALRCYRESAALTRESDAIGFLHWPVAGIAQAAAHVGDARLASDTLAELERIPVRGTRNFEVALELTRAWAAAAGGELSRARTLALGAAARAEALGQDAFGARALHDAARFGAIAEAAEGFARLAAGTRGAEGFARLATGTRGAEGFARLAAGTRGAEGFARLAAGGEGGRGAAGPGGQGSGAATPRGGGDAVAETAAHHVAALERRDGAALLDVAEAFAAQDALLLAAEAAGAAAAAFRAAGRDASARAAARRADVLLASCEGSRPPTLQSEHELDELTAREREIALLAAGGLTSREIADRLVVSIRTVDNHLQRAYRKLGITRREDLAGLVAPG